ncbi:MAG: alpha/beta hydrolase [Ornithinimicrobium sp.]
MSATHDTGRGTMITRVVTDDGVGLHVEIERPATTRAAPTVVLSHGYTLDRRCWIYQRQALVAAGYRVVLWDQRGHGRSDKGAAAAYTIDRLGSDLACVVAQAVPLGPVVLVGHSMGGMAMMAMAQHCPDVVAQRVAGVAFIDSSSGQMQRVDWGLGRRVGDVVNRAGPRVTAALAPYQRRVRAVLTALPWLGSPAVAASAFGSRVPAPVTTLTTQMMVETDFEVTSAFAPTLTSHDKATSLSTLAHLPALIMVGDRDVLTPRRHSDALARALPGAVYVLVRRAGHILVLEHPELVADHLLDLLRRMDRIAAVSGETSAEGDAQGQVRLRSTDLRHNRGRRAVTLRTMR